VPDSARPFHATLHRRPPGTLTTRAVELAGATYRALDLPAGSNTAFAISFEEAATALGRLERMFFEPDGSFVWVSGSPPRAGWQLDGMLYDRGGRLQYVELKGGVAAGEFDRLLDALGRPAEGVVFQLPRQGVCLEEAEFRRYAGLTGARPME